MKQLICEICGKPIQGVQGNSPAVHVECIEKKYLAGMPETEEA